MTDVEERLKTLEDRMAIYQILSAMGPVIDTGLPGQIADFYAEDGRYDTDVPGAGVSQERAQIAAAFDTPMHHAATARGSGHTVGFPHVTLEGDEAVAIVYTVLHLLGDEGWKVVRVAANRIRCVRSPEGWRIQERTNRLLGTDAARRLFAGAAPESR